MSFCCAGTRPSRRSAHSSRMYVGSRRGHECPVRHDDLTTVVGPELRRTKRDLLDSAGVTGHLDAVADPERTLDEDPYAREEVLEDVLRREPDDDPDDTE